MARLEVITARRGVWGELYAAAEEAARREPQLGSLLHATVLSHRDLTHALSFQIARKLGDAEVGAMSVRETCEAAFAADAAIVAAAEADLQAVAERDPAIKSLIQPLLYFKGFQALQAHRV
ncbi:MAG: serine O-acetyltransferase, partial [Brevundimonas sp.]